MSATPIRSVDEETSHSTHGSVAKSGSPDQGKANGGCLGWGLAAVAALLLISGGANLWGRSPVWPLAALALAALGVLVFMRGTSEASAIMGGGLIVGSIAILAFGLFAGGEDPFCADYANSQVQSISVLDTQRSTVRDVAYGGCMSRR